MSLFAQEPGTAEPVSATKLDRTLAAIGRAGTPLPAEKNPAPPSRPIVTAPVTEKKSAPLKNLSALDKLFPR